jgi:hypothetical protein
MLRRIRALQVDTNRCRGMAASGRVDRCAILALPRLAGD